MVNWYGFITPVIRFFHNQTLYVLSGYIAAIKPIRFCVAFSANLSSFHKPYRFI